MKKLLAIFMAALLMLFACGCNNSEVEKAPSAPSADSAKYSITLAYCANDYLNPYTSVTEVNANLSALIYEPLVGVDANYKSVNVLASDVNYEDGKISVRIKEHIVFSDGTPFTSIDVKYSFDLAKKSDSVYANNLSTVRSCEIVDDYNLQFDLSSKDAFAVNLLTFPIIKKDSDLKESSDSVLYDPIGTGRYIMRDEKLVENANYRDNDTKLKEINLINTPDNEALVHSVSAGRISVFYSDLSDGEIPKMMCKSMTVSGTNLVYIGFNDVSAASISADVRQIISEAIDRNKMCELAFIGYATPATGLFPDNLKETEGLQTIIPDADLNNVLAKLKNMGYNNKDNDGYLCNENGRIISVNILVNEESRAKCVVAEHIVSQLEEIGVKATVTYKPYNEYLSALKNGNFQMYIGEIKFKDNLDVSSLLVSGGSAAFGVKKSESTSDNSEGAFFGGTTQDRIKEFYRGDAMFSDILIYFMSELPVIPVCYKYGWLGYDASLPDNVLKPWVSNAYNGIWLFG